jgi:hypothetical protein
MLVTAPVRRPGQTPHGWHAGLRIGLGEALGQAISGVADYMAICVLLAFAAYMLLADEDESRIGRLLQVRGLAAVMLGLSVSVAASSPAIAGRARIRGEPVRGVAIPGRDWS